MTAKASSPVLPLWARRWASGKVSSNALKIFLSCALCCSKKIVVNACNTLMAPYVSMPWLDTLSLVSWMCRSFALVTFHLCRARWIAGRQWDSENTWRWSKQFAITCWRFNFNLKLRTKGFIDARWCIDSSIRLINNYDWPSIPNNLLSAPLCFRGRFRKSFLLHQSLPSEKKKSNF